MSEAESFWCHEASNIRCVRASDYDALRQQLADVSNERDGLREQVRIFNSEDRCITLSGCEFTEDELLRRAVRAVRGNRRNTYPRWALVRDAFGCGSGVGTSLCRRFGFDPEEVLKS